MLLIIEDKKDSLTGQSSAYESDFYWSEMFHRSRCEVTVLTAWTETGLYSNIRAMTYLKYIKQTFVSIKVQ
jgi:23S rRNA G2445 N2-methylase RlmL